MKPARRPIKLLPGCPVQQPQYPAFAILPVEDRRVRGRIQSVFLPHPEQSKLFRPLSCLEQLNQESYPKLLNIGRFQLFELEDAIYTLLTRLMLLFSEYD